ELPAPADDDRRVRRQVLAHDLSARPAWHAAAFPVGVQAGQRQCRQWSSCASRDGAKDRVALGAHGQAVAGRLDVAADEGRTIGVANRGAYAEVGIWCVRALRHQARLRHQVLELSHIPCVKWDPVYRALSSAGVPPRPPTPDPQPPTPKMILVTN